MRITEGMRSIHSLQNMSKAADRLDKASRVASSGYNVENPSDDPAAYSSMLAADTQLSRIDARATVLDRTASDLELAESALAGGGDILTRARELAMEMTDGTLSASDRANAASEVRALKESLAGVANTRGATGFLFAGTNTQTQPFDSSGNYAGNSSSLRIEVGDNVVDDASAKGAEAFTTAGVAGRNPFADLETLATALENNDVNTIQQSLSNIDDDQKQLSNARSDAGAKIDRFRAASSYLGQSKTTVSKARSTAIEADAPAAYSELTIAQSAYERALSVTQKILSISTNSTG